MDVEVGMKRVRLRGVLGAISVLAFAGLAQSSSHTTQVVVVGFDEPTDVITGVNGNGIGYFQRNPATRYVPGQLRPTAPPNPCNNFIRQWNKALEQTKPNKLEQVTAKFLRKFAHHNCQAVVGGEDQTFPINLESYEPVEQP